MYRTDRRPRPVLAPPHQLQGLWAEPLCPPIRIGAGPALFAFGVGAHHTQTSAQGLWGPPGGPSARGGPNGRGKFGGTRVRGAQAPKFWGAQGAGGRQHHGFWGTGGPKRRPGAWWKGRPHRGEAVAIFGGCCPFLGPDPTAPHLWGCRGSPGWFPAGLGPAFRSSAPSSSCEITLWGHGVISCRNSPT